MPYQVTDPDAGESAAQLPEILRNGRIKIDLALAAQLIHCYGCQRFAHRCEIHWCIGCHRFAGGHAPNAKALRNT
jgi:hypothetical protein